MLNKMGVLNRKYENIYFKKILEQLLVQKFVNLKFKFKMLPSQILNLWQNDLMNLTLTT